MTRGQAMRRIDDRTRHERVRDQMVSDVYGPFLKSWDMLVHYMHRTGWVPTLKRSEVAQACLGIMLDAHGEQIHWQ